MSDADWEFSIVDRPPPGGQQVGVTATAIKALHIPTGNYAVCKSERSQHKNKSTAKLMVEYGLAELGYATSPPVMKEEGR